MSASHNVTVLLHNSAIHRATNSTTWPPDPAGPGVDTYITSPVRCARQETPRETHSARQRHNETTWPSAAAGAHGAWPETGTLDNARLPLGSRGRPRKAHM